jgi:hypothetical protein
VEDEDDVGGHALICNDDFLTAIDDEVPALVVLALFSVLDFFVSQVLKLAKLRANHHWYFSKEDVSGGEFSHNLFFPIKFCSLVVIIIVIDRSPKPSQ